MEMRLVFGAVGVSRELYGYTDAYWAGCVETRRSTGGYVFMLNGGAVRWMSKKQDSVANNSC